MHPLLPEVGRAGDGGPSGAAGVEGFGPGIGRREAPADDVDPASNGARGGKLAGGGHAGAEGPAPEAEVEKLDGGRGDAVDGPAEDEEGGAEGGAGGAEGGVGGADGAGPRGGEEDRVPTVGRVEEVPAGLVRRGADVETEEGLGDADVGSEGEEGRGAEEGAPGSRHEGQGRVGGSGHPRDAPDRDFVRELGDEAAQLPDDRVPIEGIGHR